MKIAKILICLLLIFSFSVVALAMPERDVGKTTVQTAEKAETFAVTITPVSQKEPVFRDESEFTRNKVFENKIRHSDIDYPLKS